MSTAAEFNHYEFFKHHALSFTSGAVIGGVISNSIEGAILCGCASAVFSPEVDHNTQLLATAVFAGFNFAIKDFSGSFLCVFTSLMFSHFHRGMKVNTLVSTLIAYGIRLDTADFIKKHNFALFSMATQQPLLAPTWQWVVNMVDTIFAYRICQGLVFVPALVQTLYSSEFLGINFLLQNELIEANDIPGFCSFVKRDLVIIATNLCGSIISAEIMNYITARHFGDTKRLIPLVILAVALLKRKKLSLLNTHRITSGPRVLPHNHRLEVYRRMRLIISNTQEEDVNVEISTSQQIAQMQETRGEADSPPASKKHEITQLQKYISQLKRKLAQKPGDPKICAFLTSARKKLEKVQAGNPR